jgi:hypothetical protein
MYLYYNRFLGDSSDEEGSKKIVVKPNLNFLSPNDGGGKFGLKNNKGATEDLYTKELEKEMLNSLPALSPIEQVNRQRNFYLGREKMLKKQRQVQNNIDQLVW